MYDIVYNCLDNSEEVYRTAVPEKSELKELEQVTLSGELLYNKNDVYLHHYY